MLLVVQVPVTDNVTTSENTRNDKNFQNSSENNNSGSIKKRTEISVPVKEQLSIYKMNVTFNENSVPLPSMTGTMNFSYLNTENKPIDYLYFNLWPNSIEENSLVINSINTNSGSPLNWSIIQKIYLHVNLIEPVPINSREVLIINFTTYLPFVEGRFGYQNTFSPAGKTIFSFTNWFPILAVYENNNFTLQPYVTSGEAFYSDMAYYNVLLTVNKNLTVASGGLAESVSNDSIYNYFNYTLFPAREISFIMSTEFKISSENYKGIELYSYYFSEDQIRGSKVIDIIKKSLDLFSNIYTPYPYKSMSVVDFPFIYGGMEYTGLVQIAHARYSETNNFQWIFESVVVHEISHDWNTYIVGNNPYSDPWLDESWAMYSEILYFEHYNQSIVSDLLENFRLHVYIGTKQGIAGFYPASNLPLNLGMDYFGESGNINAYETTIYFKGALIIDLLRTYLGEQLFSTALSDYYKIFSYKTVNTSQFIASFESSTKQDLSWFYNAFILNSTYIDRLKVQVFTAEYNKQNNELEYNFILSQESNYTNFPLKIPISFTINNEFIKNELIWLNGSSNIITGSFVISKDYSNNDITLRIDPETKLIRTAIQSIRSTTNIQKKYVPSTIITSSQNSTHATPSFDILSFIAIALVFVKLKKRKQRDH